MLLRVITACLIMMFSFGISAATDNDEKKVKLKETVNFEDGKYYQVLQEQIVPETVPLLKFFYFGCRACYQISPDLSKWSQRTGTAISLVPLHGETSQVDAARLFHTFAEMGVLGAMYELGYVIFQTEEVKLQGKERIDFYLDRHKVDKETFWQAWSSEAVKEKLRNSLALSQKAAIHKTPGFVVRGKYLVKTEALASFDELFELLTYLLNKKPAQTV